MSESNVTHMNQVDLKVCPSMYNSLSQKLRLSNLDDGFLYDFFIVFNVVFGSKRSVGLESMVISPEFL